MKCAPMHSFTPLLVLSKCLEQEQSEKSFSRKLVLDYSGCPIQFTCPAGSLAFEKQPVYLTDIPSLGEADIKYLRWAHVFQVGRAERGLAFQAMKRQCWLVQGNIIAHSVDGDFIPIALIHREMTPATLPYRVALYRLKYNAPGSSNKNKKLASGQMQLTGRKRKSDGKMEMAASATAPASTQSNSKREYEYVDIHALYDGLCHVLDQNVPELLQGKSPFYMRMIALLIGLSGTDFSRFVLYTRLPPNACKVEPQT